jgi:4-amino-4-deoxy-L-arabinose transferase-like glycosyltransferase
VTAGRFWALALGVVVLAGLALRLHGLHDPILDHPGWRQGDTAAIARNFATLDLNPLHPQTDYDGPPPNYVELELQIVPFLAALLYKVFGVHEVFGRLISIAFGLGTIVLIGLFARRLFGDVAGIVAAALLAVYPGSVYYSRTFTPEAAMTFFLTGALYYALRFFREPAGSWRGFAPAACFAAAALLAKPVAAVELVPIVALAIARFGLRGALRAPQTWALLAAAIVPYAAYDAYVSRIAEWHWASGITRLHVLPALGAAFTSGGAFLTKLHQLWNAFGMLATTMLGPFGFALFAVAIVVPVRKDARPLLFAWLAAAVAYAYVVVTVERVDYYLSAFMPLAALWSGALVTTIERARIAAAAVAAVVIVLIAWDGRHRVRAYYAYPKAAYSAARALDATLPPGALVVMGHYDPSVLYYINRKGWEEDPYLWTPFDEQSAIRKGARYFIAIENNRLKRNVELDAWLQRFPMTWAGAWPVYETDNGKLLPGAEERWRAFRSREKAGTLPAG